jgi:hypothetical protein
MPGVGSLSIRSSTMPHTAYFALLVVASTLTVACNPREMPGLKQLGRREEARIRRETEEAIKTSPALQQLNEFCTREIPVPDGFVLANKSRSVNEPRFLPYGYRLPLITKQSNDFTWATSPREAGN